MSQEMHKKVLEKVILSVDLIRQLFQGMSSAVKEWRDRIDKMNYYPVPDADTGKNLAKTIYAASEAAEKGKFRSPKQLIDKLEDSLLETCPGNMGAIMSEWLTSFLLSLRDQKVISPKTLAKAFEAAAKSAQVALGNPKQGTALDPINSSSQAASKHADQKDLNNSMKAILAQARIALEDTTKKLRELLIEKGVVDLNKIDQLEQEKAVDAGALGFVIVLEALLEGIREVSNEQTTIPV